MILYSLGHSAWGAGAASRFCVLGIGVLRGVFAPAVAKLSEVETDELRGEVRELVGEELGKPFRPREVRFVDEFPVTQSGKIVRRAIQARHTGDDIGDLSSVENPEALDAIDEAR